MTIYRKASGSWTTILNIYRRSAGVWTSVENVYRRASGVWNSVFLRNNSPVIKTKVEISSNESIITDGQTATLTGRNYSWTPTSGLTLTYRFEKSTSISFASSTLVASGSIANPASGSSNTVTRSISPSDFSQTDMYFRFRVTAVNSSGTTASVSDIIGVSYYGTPVPQAGSPSITGSTTVGNDAFGNIGVWTNSPTSYVYRWYFMSGATSHPLTFSQSRSVSNKFLSGFSAALVTSASHGYKVNDTVIVSGMDSLFNGSHTITAKTNDTIYLTLPTPTGWLASTAYSVGSLVSYLGDAYYASIAMPAPTLFSISSAYNIGDNAWDGFTRYRCIQALPTATAWSISSAYSVGTHVLSGSTRYICAQSISSASAWSSSTNYTTGSIVHFNGTRWQAEVSSGPGFLQGAQTPSSSNVVYWSEINVSLSNSSYWTQINASLSGTSYWANAYPYNSSYWTLQSFSNTAASGTTTAPNYYEGTVSSSTSFLLTVPTIDYRSQLNMIGKALYFAVKAYNPATSSPSEYSNYKLVYGYPSITVGSITTTATTASIPYTHSHMTEYDIDILFGGTSIGGIYPRTVLSPSSPISVTGLTAPKTYSYNITPKNGEKTAGAIASGTFDTILQQWTVTWNANGGSGGGTTVQDKGLSHTAPSPGIRAGYTFNGYYDTPSGDYLYGPIASGGSFTPTANTTMTARWSVTPIIPTITMGANSGVSQTAGTINWSSTNQASFSSTGTFSGTGTTGTSISKTGLTAGTNYTGTVTVTSSTGNTASTNYSLTTSVAQYTVTWNANGGTGGGSTGPFNAGTSHTAPSPGTRAGYTFNAYYNTPSGDYLYGPIASGGSFNTPSNITMYARWSAVVVPGSVSSISASTGGRTGASTWNSPKSTFVYTFANTTSATARIQRSTDNSTWTGGAIESLSISSNQATQSTSQPTGSTSASGNFYYRAQVISINGTTLGTPITSASILNSVTPKNSVAVYP